MAKRLYDPYLHRVVDESPATPASKIMYDTALCRYRFVDTQSGGRIYDPLMKRFRLVALLNLLPVIPDGTPTSTYDVTDTAFKVISSVSTNSSTVVELEYGTTTGVYTNTVTAAESPISATGDVNFSLTGLTPYTNYYFRVKAVNSSGTAYSNEFVQRTTEPSVISDGNTVGWYDYTAADTITKDGSNFISQWRSRIGTNHLNQAVGTNQPLHTANGVLFDGVDNFMKTAAFTFNQPEEIFLLIRQVTWINGDYVFEGNAALTGGLLQTATTPRIVTRVTNIVLQSDDLTLNEFKIVRVLFNGANSEFQIDNNTIQTGSHDTTPMGGFTLGSRGNNLNWSNIEVKEVILRKVAATAEQRAIIMDYLNKKKVL